jgi:type IV pilus assembly protein PilW
MNIRAVNGRIDRETGFTIIELLVAMAIGLVVLGALVTLLVQTNQANRINTGAARMQENARFALDLISRDLRLTGAQYCSSFENVYPERGFNVLRALRVHADGPMPNGLPDFNTVLPPRPVTATPIEPFLLSPRFFIQGHECDAAACLPALDVLGADAPGIPAMGTSAGQRPLRSDVLTVRFLAQDGLPLLLGAGANGPNPFTVIGDPATDLDFLPGDLLMLADCSTAEVFEADVAGSVVRPSDDNDAGGTRNFLGSYIFEDDDRLFNFSRGFRTVSFYLQNRADPDEPGRLIPVLMRRINGVAEELVEGVERLDFRYVVEDAFNGRHVLTAQQVQAGVSAAGVALQCQPPPTGLIAQEPGCLWRSVGNVEVSLLVNTVENVLGTPSGPYTYSFDDLVDAAPTTPMPHGLPPERMLRREFIARVALRNITR